MSVVQVFAAAGRVGMIFDGMAHDGFTLMACAGEPDGMLDAFMPPLACGTQVVVAGRGDLDGVVRDALAGLGWSPRSAGPLRCPRHAR